MIAAPLLALATMAVILLVACWLVWKNEQR